jgi:F0F1-type ATP synthase membrane subunit c/vacuolar-type H+-ATPase subunit K
MIQSAARQPEARMELRRLMWLGFALTEAVIFYARVGATLLVVFV